MVVVSRLIGCRRRWFVAFVSIVVDAIVVVVDVVVVAVVVGGDG